MIKAASMCFILIVKQEKKNNSQSLNYDEVQKCEFLCTEFRVQSTPFKVYKHELKDNCCYWIAVQIKSFFNCHYDILSGIE